MRNTLGVEEDIMSKSGITRTILTASHRGEAIRVPFIEILGADDGPILTIVAGVHGSEYAGIEAAIRLSQITVPGELRGTLRIVPLCNLPAFLARAEVVCPVDGKNLNRVFPGDPQGTYSDVLADLVFTKVVEGSDYVLNVHGGDIFEALVPYVGIGECEQLELNKRCRELGRVYDLPFLVTFAGKRSASYGSLNTAAQTAGIPAILAEAGGEGVLAEEFVQVHLKGFSNVMKYLAMIEGKVVHENETKELTSDFWRITQEGIFYSKVTLGNYVETGDEIGILTDWFGETIEVLKAPRSAYILAIVTTPAARKDAVIYQVAY